MDLTKISGKDNGRDGIKKLRKLKLKNLEQSHKSFVNLRVCNSYN